MRSDGTNRRWLWALAFAAGAILLFPLPAMAMHISEGILSAPWAGLWFAVAIPVTAWGLYVVKRRRRAQPKYLALVALVGAAVFVISCMPVPVPLAGTCSHPCGTGLGAVLIGPGPTVVVTGVALALQAMFLAHGGLTTLGANIVSMGVVGAFSAHIVFKTLKALRVPVLAAVFFAAMVSDWATYATTSAELAAALHGDGSFWTMFTAIAVAFMPTQLPLGVLEGLLTAGAYRFVMSRRPELLKLQLSAIATWVEKP